MTRATTRTPRAPLDPSRTSHRPNLKTGRPEVWTAGTPDGVWLFERMEDRGTTWTITHVPSRVQLYCCSSLLRAREQVATGWALAEVERRIGEAKLGYCIWRGQWSGAGCTHVVVEGTTRCRFHPEP